MDLLKTLRRHQDVDIFCEAPVAMKEERHATGNRVGNPKLVQASGDRFKGLMDCACLFEVHTSLFQRPSRVAIQKLFVNQHGCPLASGSVSLDQVPRLTPREANQIPCAMD